MWWRILIYGFLLVLFILGLSGWIGEIYANQRSAYEKKFERLTMIVRYGTLDPITYKNIKQMFLELSTYDTRDSKALEELESEFLDRYKDVKPNEKK